MAPQIDAQHVMEQYLTAFKARNLEGCMSYFSPDATLEWMMGEYTGCESIEEWHRDRFSAELNVVRVDSFSATGSSITLDVVVQSKRLASWRIPNVLGRVTAQLSGGKIQHVNFAVKSINPQQNWS
jgi:hypothetical protein